MSQRETQISGSLQQWKGVDQRTQPTLVPEGFFVMAKGVYFGLGDNAERIPGKLLSIKMVEAVVSIVQFGEIALLQTLNGVWRVPVSELATFEIIPEPGAPDAPTFGEVTYFSIVVILPAALPANTLSFTLERSLDDAIWAVVDTGLAPLQNVLDEDLDEDTTYYYRVVAVGVSINTNGPSDFTTTDEKLPDAPDAPSYSDVLSTSFDLTMPDLPPYGVDMDLERSADSISWSPESSGYTGGEIIPFPSEANGVEIFFRAVANNVHGSTNGFVSSVTPGVAADYRIAENSDIRITEDGDFRIPT